MTNLDIGSVKFSQPLACKCGRVLTRSDVRVACDRCEVVCSACHASVLEIECIGMEAEPWD